MHTSVYCYLPYFLMNQVLLVHLPTYIQHSSQTVRRQNRMQPTLLSHGRDQTVSASWCKLATQKPSFSILDFDQLKSYRLEALPEVNIRCTSGISIFIDDISSVGPAQHESACMCITASVKVICTMESLVFKGTTSGIFQIFHRKSHDSHWAKKSSCIHG